MNRVALGLTIALATSGCTRGPAPVSPTPPLAVTASAAPPTAAPPIAAPPIAAPPVAPVPPAVVAENVPEDPPDAAPASGDAIDRLVAYLRTTGGMWVNGLSPTLHLPATATPDEVAARALRGYDGLRTTHVVLVRHVDLGDSDVRDTAALVDTNLGQRIVLMGFDRARGWDTKVFDTSR